MKHTHDHPPCATCYQARTCRCNECKLAQRRYRKRRQYEVDHGVERLVDAAPAREHALRLIGCGMTITAVAEAAGMHRGSLSDILRSKGRRPRTERVARAAAARILAVRFDADASARVDATGTVRRVRDLALLGFTSTETAKRTGLSRNAILSLRRGEWATVRASLRDTVRDAHPVLAESGPHLSPPRQRTRARLHGQRSGWVRLGYYDDPDNPLSVPATGGEAA